jgi:dihydrofolate synthase/folylpolyglutamate synthase
MTYDEALAYWFEHVNYEQRVPIADDLKLDRMRALACKLGNPHDRLRIVHITGSKGKGSTAAMLASCLTQAGYRTGLFTSPHLVRLEERFVVDGQPISPEELTQLISDVREAIQSPPKITPTFFEIATAMGFLHFVRRRVDIAVIEVGLGGRLDSTNICHPLLSVITSISYEHTRILGNRLWQIAREKAGIIKPFRPVVSGVLDPEPRPVIQEIARQRNAPLLQLDRDFSFSAIAGTVRSDEIQLPRVRVRHQGREDEFAVNLLGAHQAANAAVAVASLDVLRRLGLHLSIEATARGLAGVSWPARMEVMSTKPFIILDCAHNTASAQAVIDTLTSSFPPQPRTLLFAGSSDKDIAGMFRIFGPQVRRVIFTRYTTNTRAVPPEQLANLWRSLSETQGVEPELANDPREALQVALTTLGPEEMICITGSVFLAGELRPLLLSLRDAKHSSHTETHS